MLKKNEARIVFMGTPDFSVPILRMLVEEGYQVAGVVTQPDRPKGRKRALTPPPVKEAAQKLGLPVFQPEKIKAPEAVQRLREFAPDVIVTAAYGQILPKAVLDLPAFGCINVHASLLPKYRGGAPIQHAIMNGETETGVTIMYMNEGLDTGDMIAQVKVPITLEDNGGTMHDKLSAAGTQLLKEVLPDIISGQATRTPQNDAEASYSPNITQEDERIRWDKPTMAIYNQVRALSPWPGAYTLLHGERLKIWACFPPQNNSAELPDVRPGTVLDADDRTIRVKTGDGAILLKEIQLSGKKRMSAADFLKGSGIAPGTVLGADPGE
jgi:methionyl-tRNA formyltransferase